MIVVHCGVLLTKTSLHQMHGKVDTNHLSRATSRQSYSLYRIQQVCEIMIPYSRGKRMLELSLQNANKRTKEHLPCFDTVENTEKTGDADVSVLGIPTNQLINVPEDANMSLSVSEFSDLDLPVSEISSSLKVANFVLNHADDPPNDTRYPAGYSLLGQSSSDASTTILRAEEGAENYIAAPCNDQVVEGPEEVGTEVDLLPIEPSTDLGTTSNIDSSATLLDENHVVASCDDCVVEGQVDAGTDIQPIEQIELIDLGTSAGNTLDGQDETTNGIGAHGKPKKKTKKQDKKENREHGKAYLGRYYDKDKKKFVEVMKEPKVLGDRCECKTSYHHCKEISDQDREKIFSDVWEMTWGEKEVFIKMAIETKDVKRRGNENSKRDKSLVFTLRGSTGTHRVCKNMFLKTTGLTWWMIRTTLSDTVIENGDSSSQAHNTTHSTTDQSFKKKPSSNGRLFLKEFFERLPKMPAHCCRKDTSKLYLETAFKSAADMYREYKKICIEESKPIMSMTIFTEQMKAGNIAIFIPRKDQCDLCCEYVQGNTSEKVYIEHRARKEAAQAEKTKDKNQPLNSRTKVLCVDVQRVLLSPCLKASALYYKTKVQVHNYTVFDICSRDVVCYLWNEAEGGLTANEFASCLVHYLTDKKDSFDTAIIYSDGCTYQNRNRMLGTALRYFCVNHKKTVEQKILERGDTQMEVDSVHATVERRLKHVDIYSPLDYVQLIQAARINPCPYEVQYLTYNFFSDFDTFEGAVRSLKPSKDANVTSICALKYLPGGSICYKLNFSYDWAEMELGRNIKLPSKTPSKLYHGRRKIKKTKYDHLQSLKPVLPADVHPFYDSLQHT